MNKNNFRVRQEDIDEFIGPLNDILQDELKAGNIIEETWRGNWPYPNVIAIKLANPFHASVTFDDPNVTFQNVSEIHYWKSSYYDKTNGMMLICGFEPARPNLGTDEGLNAQPTKQFQSTVTCDLPIYKEFMRSLTNMVKSRAFLQVLAIIYMAAYVLTIPFFEPSNIVLLTAIILLIYGIIKWVNRGGGLGYKRLVSNNNGQVPRNHITIAEGKIHARNLDNGNTLCFDFDKVRKIGETKNLIVILLDLQQGLMLDKRTLSGGTLEELRNHLLTNCPKLKKRKVQTGNGYHIRHKIVVALFILCVVLSLIQWISGGKAFGRYGYNPYEENYGASENWRNEMTYAEIAVNLESLGIEGITDEMVNLLQKEWDDSPEEYRMYVDKTANLLTVLGSGTHDPETWEWSPTSTDVYAFDMEFLNVDTMYTEFLQGVASLGEGDLDFTDIEENLDKVDWDNGTGSRSVKFMWRGANSYLGAEMMNDWFDFSFADNLNEMIAAQCDGKQLYFGNDGYQMVFVFYCDAEWAESFEAATGMKLSERLS